MHLSFHLQLPEGCEPSLEPRSCPTFPRAAYGYPGSPTPASSKAERRAGLTAGRAKKETPMRVNVAARSLPFQV